MHNYPTITIDGNCHALPNRELAASLEFLPLERLEGHIAHLKAWYLCGQSVDNLSSPFRGHMMWLLNREYYFEAELARRAESVDGGGI